MANIFSGIFSGGRTSKGPNAAQMAKYNQELSEYDEERIHRLQQEDYASQKSGMDAIIDEMDPARRSAARLAQMQLQGRTTNKAGQTNLSDILSQRGLSITDRIKQDKATIEAGLRDDAKTVNDKTFHQYKVDNPIPAGEGAKLKYIKEYIGEEDWEKLSDKERRILMDKGSRGSELIDLKNHFLNIDTKETFKKELIQAGIEEKQAGIISENLNNFYGNVDSTATLIDDIDRQQADIMSLAGMSDYTTTGYGAWLNAVPLSDAAAWNNLKETVVSNIGLDKILSLKASSAQGATGLGALNEQELKMLQDYMGNLRQTSDPKRIKEILKGLYGKLDTIKKQRYSALKRNRADFNREKWRIGKDPKLPDRIPAYQQKYFEDQGPYNPLGTGADSAVFDMNAPIDGEMSDEDLLRIMSGGTTK